MEFPGMIYKMHIVFLLWTAGANALVLRVNFHLTSKLSAISKLLALLKQNKTKENKNLNVLKEIFYKLSLKNVWQPLLFESKDPGEV